MFLQDYSRYHDLEVKTGEPTNVTNKFACENRKYSQL